MRFTGVCGIYRNIFIWEKGTAQGYITLLHTIGTGNLMLSFHVKHLPLLVNVLQMSVSLIWTQKKEERLFKGDIYFWKSHMRKVY